VGINMTIVYNIVVFVLVKKAEITFISLT